MSATSVASFKDNSQEAVADYFHRLKGYCEGSLSWEVNKGNLDDTQWAKGLFDREDEHKGHASKAPCSIPAATFRKAILNSLAPLGAGVA